MSSARRGLRTSSSQWRSPLGGRRAPRRVRTSGRLDADGSSGPSCSAAGRSSSRSGHARSARDTQLRSSAGRTATSRRMGAHGFPTKLVTVCAGSESVQRPPLTLTDVWLARSSLDEVTDGVIVQGAAPEMKTNVRVVGAQAEERGAVPERESPGHEAWQRQRQRDPQPGRRGPSRIGVTRHGGQGAGCHCYGIRSMIREDTCRSPGKSVMTASLSSGSRSSTSGRRRTFMPRAAASA